MFNLFVSDLQQFGFNVAWFNLRFNLAWKAAQFLIRKPIKLTVKDDPSV